MDNQIGVGISVVVVTGVECITILINSDICGCWCSETWDVISEAIYVAVHGEQYWASGIGALSYLIWQGRYTGYFGNYFIGADGCEVGVGGVLPAWSVHIDIRAGEVIKIE